MIRRTWLRISLVAIALPGLGADYTALDKYVEAPDASFRYELVNTIAAPGLTVQVLDMTSQTWLTEAEVDRTAWRHWVVIYRPERLATSTALLFINGGSNGGQAPVAADPIFAALSVESAAVIIDLQMVPNQPLTFAGESRPRSEDALIAYTWDRFLKTRDERWPARLPMTKSAVRAMDAATAFCATPQGGGIRLERFVVAGGSKRGWTTWTTAAVDPRVVAIAPLVIDALNLERSFIHHWRAYGFWSSAIKDYTEVNLLKWLGTPEFAALMEIEDPYSYRERLSMPKYLVYSAGDQFFLPDSSQFYFDDLPGEKYLRYVPNTDHYLESLDAVLGLAAWVRAVITNYPRPRFYWRADRAEGKITVRTVDKPLEVRLWQASNPAARDFRLETIGPAWTSRPLEGDKGTYVAAVPAPERGWTAFFVELKFASGSALPFAFTTEVVVVPDTYPFEPPRPDAMSVPSGWR